MRGYQWGVLGLVAVASLAPARAQQPVALDVRAPEVAGATAWINSAPLKLSQLRGHVVVLHFWTFG